MKPIQSFAPAAAMVYTDLENLKGLIKPTDYGSGVEFADGILNSLFPNIDAGLQVSWLANISPSCYYQRQCIKSHFIENETS